MSKATQHHWSGWPGAFCLKCRCEDPIEIAFAEGNYTHIEDGSDNGRYEFPNVKISDCPVIGVLEWNSATKQWDLIREAE